MTTSNKQKGKAECLNPNTGRKMNIDSDIYNLFSKAIYHTLKEAKKGISFTEITDGVEECFRKKKTVFKGAVAWYTVTVKNDMEVRGVIEIFMERGKKLHRLK